MSRRKYNKQNKLHIRKGDTVKVLSGSYAIKGKIGTVLEVDPKRQRAIVDGLNVRYKHVKQSQKYPNGGIIEFNDYIHISKLQLIDPKTGKPTRIGRKLITDKNGVERYVRYAKKSGEIIPDRK
ncbi:MAG: 50S ribosomal protein L24 [Bacteroidia bacterium]|nr:50S ribosomal protein L24 [Bacteroidia bacterium]MDW8301292.1 50S ribosomal protein L24 [Bacteroidia bacterium]